MKLTMTGRITACVLLAYRTPRHLVEPLVPPGLELVTRGDWAFWNVVASRIERMRPHGVPAACGLSYHHVAYRLYVRSRGVSPPVEGLFFVRSDADNALIASSGNWFTDFRFHRSDIKLKAGESETRLQVCSQDAAAEFVVKPAANLSEAYESPCFNAREEAAQFLKYRPCGLAPCAHGLALAEVFRDETQWRESPLVVSSARFQFLEKTGPHHLELATQVAPLEYCWRLGRQLPISK